MVIYKYPITPEFTLELPCNYKILDVQVQKGSPVLWVLQDNKKVVLEPHKFVCIPTGHPIDNVTGWKYIGTFQVDGGSLVFHLFEVPNGDPKTVGL